MVFHFDGSLKDETGITPIEAEGIEFVSGKVGKGILIDGKDTLVYNLGANNFNEGTIELYLKLNWNAWENDKSRIILDFYDRVGYRNRIRLYFYSSKGSFGSFLYFHIVDSSGKNFTYAYPKSNQWEGNVWHHLFISWKRGEGIKFYVDGKEGGSRVGKNKESSDWNLNLAGKKLFIGTWGGNEQPWRLEGIIDELKISPNFTNYRK